MDFSKYLSKGFLTKRYIDKIKLEILSLKDEAIANKGEYPLYKDLSKRFFLMHNFSISLNSRIISTLLYAEKVHDPHYLRPTKMILDNKEYFWRTAPDKITTILSELEHSPNILNEEFYFYDGLNIAHSLVRMDQSYLTNLMNRFNFNETDVKFLLMRHEFLMLDKIIKQKSNVFEENMPHIDIKLFNKKMAKIGMEYLNKVIEENENSNFRTLEKLKIKLKNDLLDINS